MLIIGAVDFLIWNLLFSPKVLMSCPRLMLQAIMGKEDMEEALSPRPKQSATAREKVDFAHSQFYAQTLFLGLQLTIILIISSSVDYIRCIKRICQMRPLKYIKIEITAVKWCWLVMFSMHSVQMRYI